jgi:hypothetical protein
MLKPQATERVIEFAVVRAAGARCDIGCAEVIVLSVRTFARSQQSAGLSNAGNRVPTFESV